MTTNILFEYEASAVMDQIDAETSRHAAFLRYENGGLAYDELKVHTNDRPTVTGFIHDAFRTFLARFDGESNYDFYNGIHAVGFYLPDFDTDNHGAVWHELLRYVVISSTARWLTYRSFSEYAKTILAEAESSLLRAITLLRARKFPLDD